MEVIEDRETAIEKLVRQHGSQADVDEFLDRQSRRAEQYAWMRRQGRGKSQRIVQEIEDEVLSLRKMKLDFEMFYWELRAGQDRS